MNVFRQELKMIWKVALVWMLVLCGLVLMYIAIYPTFSSDAEATRKILKQIPAAAKAALNLDVDTMLSFLGFFAFTFTNFTLAAGIHAMHVGISMLSREPRSKTTDFLLTKPRGRTSIYLQKFFAGLTVILVTWVVVVAASFGFAKAFGAGNFDLQRFAMLMLALLMIQLWFYAFGLCMSQVLKHVKATIPTTLATVFGFFIVGMLGAILNEPNLRYVSPLKFFDFVGIASGKGYELSFVLTAVISMLVAGIISYIIYTKRDIKAAA